MRKLPVVLATSMVLIVGCKVKQPYTVPIAPVPTAFQNASPTVNSVSEQAATAESKEWKQATPADAAKKSKWWEIFQDAQLNALEERIAVDNQTLRAAAARFTEARALVRETRSHRLPTLSVGGDVERNRTSMNQGLAPLVAGAKPDSNDFDLGVSVAWEPDLWGRIHTMIASSMQQAQANAADLENVRLSLQAEMASDYLMLRSLDNETKVLRDSVAAYDRALKMMEDRYQGGLTSRADVEKARTQLEATSAQLTDLGESRDNYLSAIAVLTGQLPEGFSIPEEARLMTPPQIPLGVPSELLERRPDIAAAERRVAASNSQIGIARSAYYPQVILSGALGMDSSRITRWVDGPSRFWSVGPTFSEAIFDGGRRKAGVAKSIAAYDESVANYRQSVLTAFQQVEDELASLRTLSAENEQQKRAVASAQRAEELSMNRYQGGMVSYLDVISTQSVRLQNERVEVSIERRRMQASVALIRALGGGWSAGNLPQAASLSAEKQ